jgi:ABC-type branched-subunit amino acid transport system substrate-binding protein
VKWINATGGLGGHQIKLNVCDEQSSPNGEIQCVRQLASSDAVGLVSSILIFNIPSDYPIIQQAKLPVIGGLSVDTVDGINPYSVPTTPLDDQEWLGSIAQLAKHGCTTQQGILAGTNASRIGVMNQAGRLAASWLHVKILPAIVTPVTTPDYAPFVQEAVSRGAKCIYTLQTDPIGMARAVQQNAAHPLLSFVEGGPMPAQLKTAPSTLEGVMISNPQPPPNVNTPVGAMFRSVMEKYAPALVNDPAALHVWETWYIIRQVASHLTDITRESLLAAFNKANVTRVAGPPTDFAAPPFDHLAPRIHDSILFAQIIKSGNFTVDPAPGTNGVIDIAPAYK